MKRILLIINITIIACVTNFSGAQAQGVTVRIATWNIETVGTRGTIQYDAALAILDRIGADVVAVNEVSSDSDALNFEDLSSDAGYPFTVVPAGGPFGSMRSAFMTKLPLIGTEIVHTSADLSGDPGAEDMTRYPLEIVVDIPDNPADLTLVVQHWKSGTGDDNEFRRAVESIRISQAVNGDDPVIVLGDVNEEIDSVPQSPDPFTSLPAGLPEGWKLGSDLEAELAGPGIVNDPFFPIEMVSVQSLPALQLDGSDATRPASGRRLDYIMLSPILLGGNPQAEVYDSSDEGMPGGLPKLGSPLPPSTSTDASGQLLVFADIEVGPADSPPIPTLSNWSIIGITLLLLASGPYLIHRNRKEKVA